MQSMNVDIVVDNDFELRNTSIFRESNVDIINRKFPTNLVDTRTSIGWKRREQMEVLSLHGDNNNAIVDRVEEEGSSTCSSFSNNSQATMKVYVVF